MPHRVIILAQGTGRRWDLPSGKPFLGTPKHLAIIEGETLVGRAHRLFMEAGCEVVVIAPDDDRYPEPRVTLANPFPTQTEQDKFLGSRTLWAKDARTIIAWGDVFYTDEAVATITRHPGDALHYFRRTGPSSITGHQWDESFAVSFGPGDHELVIRLAEKVAADAKAGRIRKTNGVVTGDHIRSHYAALLGLPYEPASLLRSTPRQTVIDDWTDDFDSPQEWTRWVGRRYAGRVRIGLCAPWRRGDAFRERARLHVAQHYARHGRIYFGTADGATFNRSAARNAAARAAVADGAEVLLFIDTDTIVSHEQVVAAAYLAQTSGEMVLAFDSYRRLDQSQSARYLLGQRPDGGLVLRHHASGAVAVPVSLWREIGGFDERFSSWGGEDRALWLTCNALRGRLDSHRIPGEAIHLWHPRSPERDESRADYRANVELAKRYKRAAGIVETTGCVPAIEESELDPDVIRSILREPGGPLSDATPLGRLATDEELAAAAAAPASRVTYGPSAARPARMRRWA